MKILGISSYYHDSAAKTEIVKYTQLAQEERSTRIKHDASFPKNVISYYQGK